MAGRPGRRRALLALLALVGGLLVMGGVLALMPAQPAVGDVTPHVLRTAPLPPVTPADRLDVPLMATASDVSGVVMSFGTYGGTSRCTLRISLARPAGTEVAARTVSCSELVDTSPARVLDVRPPQSPGDYVLSVRQLPAATDTGGVSVWGGPVGEGAAPAVLGGRVLDAAADVHLTYGASRSVLQRLPDVLTDVRQFGPWWAAPVVVVLLALLLPVAMAGLVAWPKYVVALLVVVALARGLLWSALTPVLEGVDETAHVSYGQFIAEQHGLPRLDRQVEGRGPYSDRLELLEERVHRETTAPGDRPDRVPGARAELARELAGASSRSGGQGPASGYPPAYYLPTALAYAATPGDLADKVQGMRLVSIALGVATTLLAYLAGLVLFPRRRPAAVALALAATLQPMASQQFGVVNNDALVLAAGALVLATAARLALRSGREWSLMLGAGAAVGLAALGKPFGAALVPLVAVGWAVSVLRRGRWEPRRHLTELGAAAVGVLATYGLWLVIRVVADVPSSGIPSTPPTGGPARTPGRYLLLRTQDGFQALRANWSTQFWGDFSWVDTPLPGVVDDAVWVVDLVLVAGIVLWGLWVLLTLARRRRPSWLQASVAVCVAMIAGTLVTLELIGFLYFRSAGGTDLLQGRYALMVVPAVMALPLLAAERVALLRRVVPVLLVGACLLLQISAWGSVTRRFYA